MLRVSCSCFSFHTVETSQSRQYTASDAADDVIDPGLWLTTIIFLALTVAFSFFSAVMALVNIAFNPVEPILR